MIQLVTLGSLQLTVDSAPQLAGRRKVLALLACLVRRAPAPMKRSELAVLLWTDRSENHAKQSLRQALAELRPILGDALLADSESVLVDAEAFAFDVRRFEEAVRLEHWDEAAQCWGGDFLQGLESVGGEAWNTWLTGERTRLREAAALAFQHLFTAADRRDDRRAALEWSQKWCDVAPLDESACTARINAHVRMGRPVDAAVCYEGFVRRLHNELHVLPSPAFEALRASFAAGRPAPAGTIVVRGTVTLSGLAQLGVDARSVAEAAAVIDAPADAATLQAVSQIPSFSFNLAIAELVRHGILAPVADGDSRWAFTSPANRDTVFSVISRDRRQSFELAAAARLGPPVDVKRSPAPAPRARSVPTAAIPVRLGRWTGPAVGVAAVALIAVINWASRVTTASAVELEPGSTILLDRVQAGADPALAGAVSTAAQLGLSQSRHVALYQPLDHAPEAAGTASPERIRALARREKIPRIIALDVTGTDSALRVAAKLIDGSSGQVLGEESVETHRARLVDDLDRLLRTVRVTLGEPEAIVRDSSRLLREVASASIEALSAYAEGMAAWSSSQPDAARDAWNRALAQDSAFALAQLALANDAFVRNDAESGDRWIRRAVQHPERLTAIDAMRARQVMAMRDGRLEEAGELAEQVARRAPSSQAWFEVGSVHAAADRCDEATAAFERALAADSTHTRSRLALSECALAQGNTGLALRQLETSRRMDSTTVSGATYALQRGRIHVRAGRFAEADSAFREVAAADSAMGFRWLAQSLMMRGRYGEALPVLQQVTRLSRQAGDGQALFDDLVLEATAFTSIGGRTRASELIDEAVAVAMARPVSVASYFRLGHLMARVGRLNGAREVLRQATVRAAQDAGAGQQWALRLLTASIHVHERNAADALTTVDAQGAPATLEPFRLAIAADASTLAGEHDEALQAARRLADAWHFGNAAQDEWLRATLRMARASELKGDTASARAAYRRYADRWKDADVFLVELSFAQRALVRLGGAAVAMNGR